MDMLFLNGFSNATGDGRVFCGLYRYCRVLHMPVIISYLGRAILSLKFETIYYLAIATDVKVLPSYHGSSVVTFKIHDSVSLASPFLFPFVIQPTVNADEQIVTTVISPVLQGIHYLFKSDTESVFFLSQHYSNTRIVCVFYTLKLVRA